jgi:preprotein translocase subunit SecE
MKITKKLEVFFKEVYVELKRVNWLSRKNVLRYTFIVLGVTLIVSAFLGALDYIFTALIKQFIF